MPLITFASALAKLRAIGYKILELMVECKRCLDLHGRGCAATHATDEGEPTCIFCLDSVDCPVQWKQRRDAGERQKTLTTEELATKIVRTAGPVKAIGVVTPGQSSGSHKQSKGEAQMETKPETTREPGETVLPKTCKRPGCTTKLGPLNRSGRCSKHFHWKATGRSRSTRRIGHASTGSNGANGHGSTAGNGTAGTDSTGSVANMVPGRPRDLVESRIDRLFRSMTIAEKVIIAESWLKGEI